MTTYFVTQSDYPQLWERLSGECRLLHPFPLGGNYSMGEVDKKTDFESLVFNAYRTTEPVKMFLFPVKEVVCGAEVENQPVRKEEQKKTVVIGVKACDLRSIEILDYVFLAGVCEDPFYKAFRESTIFVSSDCTGYKDVCFCTWVGINPFPEQGFDINVSKLDDGYLFDVATQKAQELTGKVKKFLSEPTQAQIGQRQQNRKKIVEDLNKQLQEQGFSLDLNHERIVRDNFDSEKWYEEAGKCVECGACNFSCPSCHCFFFSDDTQKAWTREKNWDSCQYERYARVAGGANARQALAERLRHRYICKFNFYKDTLDKYSCTGCGRCVEACIGRIDIRKVINELAK